MSEAFRTEKDSMGEMKVPADAYYGAQTGRAVENFPISDLRFSRRFIEAMGIIKSAAAEVNRDLEVPADAYYGAQTGRAVENFPISDLRFSRRFIEAMGIIKSAAAEVNRDL